ncbi:MAG: hypothetical protein JXA42_15655 [Anaerolineales bacterium]|nr:hypothetical protein [Anaerolineales bacterium]
MKNPKLVIIGGGSMYSAGLLEAIIAWADGPMKGAQITLMDIDANALDRMQRYAEHLLRVTGADLGINSTTERRKALLGADFVLTTFRVGGFDTLAQDEEIPLRFDMLGQETTGIGGMFMALRTIPVMLEICRDIEEICPHAWLINYTNPTNFVADAVRRRSQVRCISLCDNYVQVVPKLSLLLGADEKEITFQSAGVNHLTWILDLRVGGEPGYPRLRRRLAEVDIEELCKPNPSFDLSRFFKPFVDNYYLPWAIGLLNIFGYFPCESSYHRYYYAHDDVVKEMQKSTYVSLNRHYKWQMGWFFEKMERVITSGLPFSPETRLGFYGHGDLAIDVIVAIATNARREFIVNIPNRGAIANLPYESIVEIPVLIDKEGAHPFCLGNYPRELLGLIQAQILHQELVVDAALSGDREKALIALLANPLVRTVERAKQALNAMFEAQGDLLPQFQDK